MNLTRSEELLAQAGIIATVGCVIAFLGLFTPPEMPLGHRLAYWIIGLLAAWVVVWLLSHVGRAVAKLIGISQVWGYALVIPLSSVGISFGVLWWIGGPQVALGRDFARIWPMTLMIGLGFFGLFYVLYARASARGPNEAARNRAKEPEIRVGVTNSNLHALVPQGFPEIIAVSVEDHYVRVHAEDRSEMVLMSLAEAVELVPAEAGERVHRGWWVARAAVTGNKREGRDMRLILVNGLEVPVSRSKAGALREAGWLD